MKNRWNTAFLLTVLLVCWSFSLVAEEKRAVTAPPKSAHVSPFEDLAWREVGPYRGGRSAAVTGISAQPLVYYFGATGGGVWKTTDGGNGWKSVSDGFFGGSIGAIEVSESDPNVVYVGGGEVTVRGNVSHGDGVWKSTDAGKSWSHMGLEDSQQIPRIRTHPRDPNLVYVAALGHVFGPNAMRGVYRSRDGGKNWDRILFANRDAGAVDLILDPSNPRIIYASTWRVRRTPYSLESGGEGSALWKSTDGGDTWVNLSHNKGLPEGTLGIIGITVSPSNPQNLYAIVENENGGLFRSHDGGDTWEKTNEERSLRQRAWYYSRIYADPKDEDTVYVVNVQFHKSKDGGKTFSTIPVPHGDNHDLWIASNDALRMIEANDGGAIVSNDGGVNWTSEDNQPTAQIYRVSTDTDFPYHLLGAQQDNSALRIRHRSTDVAIGPSDWEPSAGGESGYIVADPKNPDLVFGGSYGGYLAMYNHKTQEFRDVNPWPDNPMGHGAEDYRYRFQWNFPLFFSPHAPYPLFAAANMLFRSTDHGQSWDRISDDLTRNDKSRLASSGGPITKDNTGVEYYGTIFTAAESPLQPGILWTGSDDGLIHVSRDNGKTWTNVTPKNIPQWIMINCIDPSPFEKGGAYVAATMYKSDDPQPYLFKTTDYGASWTRINNGIPQDQFTRVIRSDPARHGLLYAGTESGIHMSTDDGANWISIQGKLPIVPVTDLAVRDDQLIVATQGRGFWILDDLSPLRDMQSQKAAGPLHLFPVPKVYRVPGGEADEDSVLRNMAPNPPEGITIQFLLPDAKEDTPVKVEFLSVDNKVLRTFEGKVKQRPQKPEARPAGDEVKTAAVTPEKQPQPKPKEEAEEEKPDKDEIKLEPTAGWNRFTWDLRLERAKKFEGLILWNRRGLDGPRVVPGKYQVRVTVGETSQTQTFELVADPRSSISQADLQQQFDFLLQCRDKLNEMHEQIKKVRSVREQIKDFKKRLKSNDKYKNVLDAASELDKKMTAPEEALYQTKNKSRQDPLNFPIRLNDKLAGLAGSAGTGDFPPTAQHIAVRQELFTAIDAELARLNAIWEKDLPALNKRLRDQEAPSITTP